MYDLSQQVFQFMDLYSFTRNDKLLAEQVLKRLNPGDLLLRDMRFLVMDVLDQIDKAGTFFPVESCLKL